MGEAEAGGRQPIRPMPGTALHFRWRKWDGTPHWVHECVYMGGDEFGDWFGQPIGWRSSRPGRSFAATGPFITLMPPGGDYALTVNRGHPRIRTYIDLAWDVGWRDGVPQGIDMDLDVVDARDGRGLFIADRDEWDENRRRLSYPDAIVTRLERLAEQLRADVAAGIRPFDDATADAWLDRVEGLDPAIVSRPPRLDA